LCVCVCVSSALFAWIQLDSQVQPPRPGVK